MKQGVLALLLVLSISAGSVLAQVDTGGIGGDRKRTNPNTLIPFPNREVADQEVGSLGNEVTESFNEHITDVMETNANEESRDYGGLGETFSDPTIGRTNETVTESSVKSDPVSQVSRRANNKEAVTEVSNLVMSEQAMFETGMLLLDPAVHTAMNSTRGAGYAANIAFNGSEDKGNGPQQSAIDLCVAEKLNGGKDSADTARKACEDELKGGGAGPTTNGTPAPGQALFLSKHSAHPAQYGSLIDGGSSRAVDKIYLTDLLTVRAIRDLTIESAINGGDGSNLALMESEFGMDILYALGRLKRYSGDVVYSYDGKTFRSDFDAIKPTVSALDHYKELLAANYDDLAWLTSKVCESENRIEGLDETPFRQFNLFGANFAYQNDIWLYLRKKGLEKGAYQALKNLSAGEEFGMSIRIPTAINTLFNTRENAQKENNTENPGASYIEVNCSVIYPEGFNAKKVIDELIKKLEQTKTSTAITSREAFLLTFAHAITKAQLSHEARQVFNILAKAYGSPSEDAQFVRLVQGVPMHGAILDLRKILAIASGLPGDTNPLDRFDLYYLQAVRKVHELTKLLGIEISDERGVRGGTLKGSTASGATGNPMK